MQIPAPLRLVLLLGIGLLSACSNNTDNTDPRSLAPVVFVSHVESATPHNRRFLGIVQAHASSPISFQVGGKILERKVKNGEHVVKDQVLLQLDPKDIQLDIQAKQAAVRSAQAQHTQAQADLARQSRLVKEGAVSKQAHDQSVQLAQSAAQQLKAAQADFELSKNSMQYATLRAHADGLLNQLQADVGQVVSPGQTIATLDHDGQREIQVSLPEAIQLPLGTLAQVHRSPNEPSSTTAELIEQSQRADSSTRSYLARFALKQPDSTDWRLGSSVWLATPLKQGQTERRVPLTAIHDAGSGPGVWQLDDDEKVRFTPVQIQNMDAEYAYLQSGPSTGELIVVLGASLLHEGQTVRPQAEKANRP